MQTPLIHCFYAPDVKFFPAGSGEALTLLIFQPTCREEEKRVKENRNNLICEIEFNFEFLVDEEFAKSGNYFFFNLRIESVFLKI